VAIARGVTRRGPDHRRRRAGRWSVVAACGAVLLAGVACGAPPSAVPVPTFQAASPAPTTTPPLGPGDGGLPTDCEEIVGHDELPALLGLPMDSVTVRTVLGVPAPSVGRLERIDCTYTVTDPDTSPRGVVLRMTVGRYRDEVTAHDQHDRNVADQRNGASGSAEPDLGAAAATLVQRDARTVLLSSYGALTVDLDLAKRPGPLPPRDLLTDLARRVLAKVPSAGADSGRTTSP
jgi:hypothetical protein